MSGDRHYNIYGKLDVHSRTQAVAKARSLSLLPSLKSLV
jgi:ATP/maltotriose-dependent transcriptional regulator MalT